MTMTFTDAQGTDFVTRTLRKAAKWFEGLTCSKAKARDMSMHDLLRLASVSVHLIEDLGFERLDQLSEESSSVWRHPDTGITILCGPGEAVQVLSDFFE